MTVESDFKARTFSQFRDSPNIQALIEILSDPLQDAFDVCDFILDHSSIDDAEGEQLDQLGERIGVERPPAQETKIFTLCRIGEVQDPDLGFAERGEIILTLSASGFLVGDLNAWIIYKPAAIPLARGQLTTFTAADTIGVTADYGSFLPGQTIELEGDPLTTGVITAVDYSPAGVDRIGGHMTTMEGLEASAGGDMSDVDFRYLIRQKAAAYRSKMTREILFLYLIAFGGRCKIDDDTELTVIIDPDRYADFNEWTQNYIETRGFKPAGISVQFRDTMRHGAST